MQICFFNLLVLKVRVSALLLNIFILLIHNESINVTINESIKLGDTDDLMLEIIKIIKLIPRKVATKHHEKLQRILI